MKTDSGTLYKRLRAQSPEITRVSYPSDFQKGYRFFGVVEIKDNSRALERFQQRELDVIQRDDVYDKDGKKIQDLIALLVKESQFREAFEIQYSLPAT